MSFGLNELLVYFRETNDGRARDRANRDEAEYCIRLRGWKGPTMYTVMAYRA